MWRVHAIFLAISGLLLGPNGSALSQPTSDAIYSLLQRLELDRLQIAYLERELAEGADPARVTHYAADLAALLVRQMSAAESQEKSNAVEKRLQALLDSHPQINHPALQTTILQAEFFRVERLCQQAFDKSSDESIAGALRHVGDLLQRLENAQSQWTNEPRVPSDANNSRPSDYDAKESKLRDERVREGHLKQVQFLAAWLHYYEGVLSSGKELQIASWRESNAGFRKLIQLPPEKLLTELDSDWFELSEGPMARIVLGLGMTEQALGNSATANYCFSLLSTETVPASIRTRRASWRINSFVFADQFAQASQWLQSTRVADSEPKPPAAELAYIAQQIAGKRESSPTSSPDQMLFLNETLLHLVDAGELDLADGLLNSCAELLPTVTDPFYQHWLASRQAFQRGEKSGRAADFERAIAEASAALQYSTKQTRPAQSAQVRFLLAWSLLRADNHVSAAREFRQIAWMTRTLDPEQSAGAAWAGIQALIQSKNAEENSRQIFSAFDEFEQMHRNRPQISQAKLERLRLRASWHNDAQAAEQLAAIPPTNPLFADAQFAVCRVYRDRLIAAGDNVSEAEMQFSAMQKIVDPLSDERGTVDDRSYIKLLLLVADVALRFQPPKLDYAYTRISQARDIVEKNGWSDPILADVQAIRFRWATLSENTAEANELAQWLGEKAPTTDLKTIGAIYLAEQIERELASAPTDSELHERAFQFYRRLTEQLGDSPTDLRQSKNAFLAMARMAELEMATNRTEEADKHFEQLLSAAPNDLSLLQKAARCKTQMASYAAALELWRRIARGTQGEDWLEAKYNVIVCLGHTTPETAEEVLNQTLTLANEVPEHWRGRFEELRKQLASGRRP